MAQQGYEYDLLRQWFPTTEENTTRIFTENDIRGIAEVLGRGSQERWSRIPRIFSVLKLINRVETISTFLDEGITDHWFPFSKGSLPEGLRDHSARLRFLEVQHLVYNTKALDLERQHTRHGHFRDPSEVPLKKTGELGKGGFGYVDRVVSTITHKEYARKLILRGKTFRKDKQILQSFEKELSNLKRLSESHKHLVNLAGSYTDPRFVAIVMLPVADCNLQVFLEDPNLDDIGRSRLRPFFGCLTSALSYLHDNRIRHKDIKPSNVLIKHDRVYLTDFGTSLDWSEIGNSTTATAPPTTPRYCAPEVMAWAERNTLSDIWSLGCVFLEMWTVLKQRTLKDLRAHMIGNGDQTTNFHSNLVGTTTWLQELGDVPGPPCDLTPLTWIMQMLQQKPVLRWSVHILADRIQEASTDPCAQYAFCGLCCLEVDETSESVESVITEQRDDASVQSKLLAESISTKLAARTRTSSDLQLPKVTNVNQGHASSEEITIKPEPLNPLIVGTSSCAAPQSYVEDEATSLAREIHTQPLVGLKVHETTEENTSKEKQSTTPDPHKAEYDPNKPLYRTQGPPQRRPRSPSSIRYAPRAGPPPRDVYEIQSQHSVTEGFSTVSQPPKQADRYFAPTRFGRPRQTQERQQPQYQAQLRPSSARTSKSKTKTLRNRFEGLMRDALGPFSMEPGESVIPKEKRSSNRSLRSQDALNSTLDSRNSTPERTRPQYDSFVESDFSDDHTTHAPSPLLRGENVGARREVEGNSRRRKFYGKSAHKDERGLSREQGSTYHYRQGQKPERQDDRLALTRAWIDDLPLPPPPILPPILADQAPILRLPLSPRPPSPPIPAAELEVDYFEFNRRKRRAERAQAKLARTGGSRVVFE